MNFDLRPEYGSHLATLERELDALPSGALVLEHGVGLYSSFAIARRDVSVLFSEELPGWSSWARWLYEQHGRAVTAVERAKRLVPHLASAALLFIDGETRERGLLLQWALEHRTPLIIAHDTEHCERHHYGYRSHHFDWRDYEVTDDTGSPHVTTLWRLRA